MEKIKLSNGKCVCFSTNENNTYKNYQCETFEQAVDLLMTLTDLGNHCRIDEKVDGFYVCVKK